LFVKRCVFLFLVSILVLAASQLAKADQPPANDFAGQIMSDGGSGRVGIGTRVPAATLDVYQGEIKLGSTGVACNKELGGTLRYADSKLQLCDGAGWRNVSLDKGP
jgi:hypothetical protein